MQNSCVRGFRKLGARGRFTRVALLVSGSAAPLLLANTTQAATIVACIGEQTTKTTDGGVTADKLWPAQLGMLLGNTYQVDNDVVTNANTVMSGNCVTAASKNPVPGIVVMVRLRSTTMPRALRSPSGKPRTPQSLSNTWTWLRVPTCT